MTVALDLIKGALRRVNAYQSGEAIAPLDAQDCLDTLNDLFDSLSNDHCSIVGSTENILQWTAGKNQYKIGNPGNASLGYPNFTGYLTLNSPLITGITNLPSYLAVNATLSDVANVIPSGATVLSINAGATTAITFTAPPVGSGATISGWAGGAVTGQISFSDGESRTASVAANGVATWSPALTGTPTAAGNQINTTTVTMSANATATPSTGTDSISYTVPGDFAIARPLRIPYGFTRFNELDFTLDVMESQARYTEILYKAQPGPWPTVAWYNPQMPYGVLNVYQTPGNSAELHLYTDTLLSHLTLSQVFFLPQGYNRWIKWLLAKEICAEFGYPMTEAIKTNAADAEKKIKALNAQPAVVSRYDRALVRGNRPDGGWILSGGYR